MASKKEETSAKRNLTLAEARGRISELKLTLRVEGQGGGKAVPSSGIGKSAAKRRR